MNFYQQSSIRKELIIFAFLCLLLQATLIVSDVLTFKIASILSVTFTIPALLYPITYSIGDILTETYERKLTLIILSLAIFIELIFDLLISYSATVHNVYDQKYFLAFNYSLGNMYIAAIGVIVGSILGFTTNTTIMYFLKNRFSYKSFPLRSIFSSITGEIVFTITAFSIWFYSDPAVNKNEIIKLIISSASLKVIFSILYCMPAYWTAKKLLKNSPSEGLKIIEVIKFSNVPGESVFSFQIRGKRTGFSSRSKEVSLNIFCALNKANQNLIEADMNGKIKQEFEKWEKEKHERQNSIGDRWNDRNWSWNRKNVIA